jgi:predicted GNAT family acetyltransferase
MSDPRSTESDIRVVNDPDGGRFAIWVGEEVAGVMLYERFGDAYALMHTEVRPEFEHQGLASQLIRSTLDQLARREVGVLPYCPFVRRFVSEHREYVGLVPAADRARFGLE